MVEEGVKMTRKMGILNKLYKPRKLSSRPRSIGSLKGMPFTKVLGNMLIRMVLASLRSSVAAWG